MVAKMARRRWRSASARASCSGLGSTKLGATLRLSVAKVPSFTSMVAEQGIASADSVFAVSASGYVSGFSSRSTPRRARQTSGDFSFGLGSCQKGISRLSQVAFISVTGWVVLRSARRSAQNANIERIEESITLSGKESKKEKARFATPPRRAGGGTESTGRESELFCGPSHAVHA